MANVVEAEKFVLRGPDGKTRGEFGLSGDIVVLRLNDGAEKSRAEMTVGADGSPNLALHDARGRDRAYLHLHDDIGGISFGLKDDHSGIRVLAVVGPDGTPGIGLMDENGETRVDVKVEPSGTAAVRLNDKNGKLRAAVTADAVGVQGLFVTDAAGAFRMKVAVDSTGAPVVGLLDARGQTQAALAISDATGSPQLVLFDRDGKPKMALHVGIDGVARDVMRPWWRFWR